MTAYSPECALDAEGGPPGHSRRAVGRANFQHTGPDCEFIVSDGEEAPRLPPSYWVPPVQEWAAEPQPAAALRQLNAQLPPSRGSQHQQQQVQGKSFTRRAAAPAKPAAFARSSSGGSSSRPGFRRLKTVAAAQADQAAVERAAAEEAEPASALVAAEAAGNSVRGVEEQPQHQQHQQHEAGVLGGGAPEQRQRQQVPEVPRPSSQQPVAAAARPASRSGGGGSFLNRTVLPRSSSQTEKQVEQGNLPAAGTAGPGRASAEAAAAAAGGSSRLAECGAAEGDTSTRQQQQQRQEGHEAPAAQGRRRSSSAAAAAPAPALGSGGCSGAASARPSSVAPKAPVAAAVPGPGAASAAPTAPAPARSRGTAASSAPAPALPAATFHRTADGLNVVYLNRQAAPQPSKTTGSKAKSDSVNTGWGNNFVRMDLKKGRGSTKYGTKYGSKRRKAGGGAGRGGRGGKRWQTSRLRQVGDGSDYMEGWQGSKLRCFKCGGSGHYARDCTAEQQAQADMGALLSSSDEEDGRDLGGEGTGQLQPRRHQQYAGAAASQQQQQGSVAPSAASWGPSGGPGRVMSAASLPPALPVAADPAEQHAKVLADPSEEALTGVLQAVFGHPSFRGLQLATVQRLLGGESLLSIMPTGMGKSLCYQLPALLLPGLTLVVSPLIALMHDQAASVPPPLTAAVLWAGQTRADAVQILCDVAAGRIKILFVSPERLNNPHLLEALRPRMPLPLVVVDEAHCVAEWGHSFRPAYFRLGAALAGSVQAQRILALTATATRATEEAIRQVLRIPAESVLRDAAVRQNLRLQVLRTAGGGSSQATRDRICALFTPSGSLARVRSAIVYCAFKEDANQLARLMGARGINARAYHAGKDYRERAAVEADFAAGRVRVVVATVAFGMGINLARVSAVVHNTMPRSLEEYVQQIGRAGRDGSEAHCVALLDDSDFLRLRSLAFSGVLDLQAVRSFLEAVFSPAAEGQKAFRRGASKAKGAAGVGAAAPAASKAAGRGRKRKAAADAGKDEGRAEGEEGEATAAAVGADAGRAGEPGNGGRSTSSPQQQQAEAGDCAAAAATDDGGVEAEAEEAPSEPRRFGVLAVKKLADELDMREESMETVLSYMEAEEGRPCLRMLPTAALSVKVSFYAAAPQQLAGQYPVVQIVLETCPNPRNGVYSVPAAKLAAGAQKAPGLVLQELRELAAGGLIGFELSRDEGPAYEILHTPSNLDALAQQLHARLAAVLACQVSRLDVSYRALAAAVRAGQAAAAAHGPQEQQAAQEVALRAAVERYFDEEEGAAGQPAADGSAAGAGPSDSAQLAECSGGRDSRGRSGSGSGHPSSLILDTAGLPLKPAGPSLLTAARAVLRSNREQAGPALTGRALARILHGVGSPAFPPDAWHKRMGAFWGSQGHVDFGAVLRAAEIVVRGEFQAGRQGEGEGSEDDMEL